MRYRAPEVDRDDRQDDVEEPDMSEMDKIKNAAERAKGKVKEAVGHAKGDKSLQAEGKGDQAKGGLKQAAENVKDAAKDATKK